MKTLILIGSILLWLSQQAPIFDLPKLAGKNIIQIKKILGKPKSETKPTKLQISVGVTGDLDYKKNGFNLDVQYDAKTNEVVDYFISSENPKADYKIYIKACNLLNPGKYTLKPVPLIKDPNLYTGVIITPKP
jgi:hypothetical protein